MSVLTAINSSEQISYQNFPERTTKRGESLK